MNSIRTLAALAVFVIAGTVTGVAYAGTVPLVPNGVVNVKALSTATASSTWSPKNEYKADHESTSENSASSRFKRFHGRKPSSPTPAPNSVASADAALGASWAGLDHFDQRTANGGNQYSLEPPDQGLCAGGGYVIEPVNTALKIYDTPAVPDDDDRPEHLLRPAGRNRSGVRGCRAVPQRPAVLLRHRYAAVVPDHPRGGCHGCPCAHADRGLDLVGPDGYLGPILDRRDRRRPERHAVASELPVLRRPAAARRGRERALHHDERVRRQPGLQRRAGVRDVEEGARGRLHAGRRAVRQPLARRRAGVLDPAGDLAVCGRLRHVEQRHRVLPLGARLQRDARQPHRRLGDHEHGLARVRYAVRLAPERAREERELRPAGTGDPEGRPAPVWPGGRLSPVRRRGEPADRDAEHERRPDEPGRLRGRRPLRRREHGRRSGRLHAGRRGVVQGSAQGEDARDDERPHGRPGLLRPVRQQRPLPVDRRDAGREEGRDHVHALGAGLLPVLGVRGSGLVDDPRRRSRCRAGRRLHRLRPVCPRRRRPLGRLLGGRRGRLDDLDRQRVHRTVVRRRHLPRRHDLRRDPDGACQLGDARERDPPVRSESGGRPRGGPPTLTQ